MEQKTVTLYNTPMNNHGCRGYEVKVLTVTETIGVVVGGESCSSCWQVGHDDGDSPVAGGSVVELPRIADVVSDDPDNLTMWLWSPCAPVLVGKKWGVLGELLAENDLSWTVAAMPCGHSHNELVNDRGTDEWGCAKEPEPDCTVVGPNDLVIIGNIPQVTAAYAFRHKTIGFKAFKDAIDGLVSAEGT